jgi:hypothetical protein
MICIFTLYFAPTLLVFAVSASILKIRKTINDEKKAQELKLKIKVLESSENDKESQYSMQKILNESNDESNDKINDELMYDNPNDHSSNYTGAN